MLGKFTVYLVHKCTITLNYIWQNYMTTLWCTITIYDNPTIYHWNSSGNFCRLFAFITWHWWPSLMSERPIRSNEVPHDFWQSRLVCMYIHSWTLYYEVFDHESDFDVLRFFFLIVTRNNWCTFYAFRNGSNYTRSSDFLVLSFFELRNILQPL